MFPLLFNRATVVAQLILLIEFLFNFLFNHLVNRTEHHELSLSKLFNLTVNITISSDSKLNTSCFERDGEGMQRKVNNSSLIYI